MEGIEDENSYICIMKKPKIKSVDELTKGFEELERKQQVKPVTKKDFDKAIDLVLNPKGSPVRKK